MDNITIRVVTDPASCRAVEHLQQEIWGFPEREVVPYHQLMTAARWGGTLLLAYDGDRPVGFAYGFAGWDGGQRVLCSHMLGVLPAYRSRQVGYRLKLAQRDEARRAGFDRMVWTFDPLESRNAYLNLHKLGAFAETYYVNHYGEMEDDLNRGLPSDRLLADWRFGDDDRPPAPPVDLASAPVVNPPVTAGGPARPGPLDAAALAAPAVKVAVPADAAWFRRHAPDLAAAWRLSLREALTTAFARGYRAVDVEPPQRRMDRAHAGPQGAAAGGAPGAGADPASPGEAAVAYYILIPRAPEGDSR